MLTNREVLDKIKKFDLFFFIILALIFRLSVCVYIANTQYPRLIQDAYSRYADAMVEGKLNSPEFGDYDKRLYPLYPLSIALVKPFFFSSLYAGIAVSIASSLLAMYLAFRVFKDKLLILLMAISPPMWIEQSVKVANESLFVALTLSALLLFFKKRYLVTGIILGIAFATRPVAITLLVSLLFFLLQKKQLKHVGKILGGFIFPVCLLLLFNYLTFGPHEIFQQFNHADRYGQLRFGLVQIAQDFYRTLDWKDYKTFISGTVYVITNLFALGILIRYRKKSDRIYLCFLWLTATLVFILSVSPYKLLDDFGRYSLAALPAYLYGFSLFYKKLLTMVIPKKRLHKKDER